MAQPIPPNQPRIVDPETGVAEQTWLNFLNILAQSYVPEIDDLSAGSTTTQIENKINELLQALRDTGFMGDNN